MKRLLLLILLAGCTSLPDALPDDPAPPASWELANDVEDCLEAVVVLFISMADAQAVLPPGYVAADAATLLGLPADTGSSAAFFNVVQCQGATSGELAVPIEAPRLANASLAPVMYDLYQIGYISSNASLVQRLHSVGFPAANGTAEAALTALGGAALAQGQAQVDDETQYAFEAALGPVEPFPGTARFWHQSADGIIHFEYAFESQARKGAVTACTLPQGTPLHGLTGRNDCQGAEAAVVVIPSQTWQGTVRFLADARLA